MTRKPCLAEEWFIEDGLEMLAKCTPEERSRADREIAWFGNTPQEALSQIYRQSRTIFAEHVLAGRFALARVTDDWEALRVMQTIDTLVGTGTAVLAAQQPRLFGLPESDAA